MIKIYKNQIINRKKHMKILARNKQDKKLSNGKSKKKKNYDKKP